MDENSRNVEEIIIPPEKREEILNELRKYYKNGTLYKISKLLGNSIVLKFVIKLNYLSSVQ